MECRNGTLTHRLGGLARGYNAVKSQIRKSTKVGEDMYTRVNNNRARNFNFTLSHHHHSMIILPGL